MWLILLYIIQLVISDVCTNLKDKILGQVVSEKSLTTISIFITSEREVEKGNIEKECKNKSQHLCFVFSNTLGCSHHVYNN